MSQARNMSDGILSATRKSSSDLRSNFVRTKRLQSRGKRLKGVRDGDINTTASGDTPTPPPTVTKILSDDFQEWLQMNPIITITSWNHLLSWRPHWWETRSYLRCRAYLPLTWPLPSQPGVGQLRRETQGENTATDPYESRFRSLILNKASNPSVAKLCWKPSAVCWSGDDSLLGFLTSSVCISTAS